MLERIEECEERREGKWEKRGIEKTNLFAENADNISTFVIVLKEGMRKKK